MTGGPSSAVQVGRPQGMARTFASCDADVFDDQGTLTITAQRDGHVVATFARGAWTEATVYGADGYVLYQVTTESRPAVPLSPSLPPADPAYCPVNLRGGHRHDFSMRWKDGSRRCWWCCQVRPEPASA